MNKKYISVIIPVHNQSWELEKTLYSVSRQKGIGFNEFEVIVMNTNPENKETLEVVSYFAELCKNVRLIQVSGEKAQTIKNSTFPLNLGARKYAKGKLLLLAVDAARVITNMVLRKTRNEFEKWGDDIVTTTIPYHFFKHSSVPGFTVEECREAFLKTRWKKDIRCLLDYKADTNISKSGVPNESTWLGIIRENFLKVGGHNEFFTEWSSYNLDLWRRLTRAKPKDGVQIPGKVNDHWGKIGLGLEVKILEDEFDIHLHHSLSDAKRDFNVLKKLAREVWEEYAKIGDCICSNLTRLDWGTGEAEEIIF